MRSKPSVLVPVFRSRAQGELLALLTLTPSREWTVGELARQLSLPLTTVQDEVRRLADAHILTTRKLGPARLVTTNAEHPMLPALADLARHAHGPVTVVREEFADLPARAVLVFGSWAARDASEPGPPPVDVDVLVLADDLDRRHLYDAADQAGKRLHLQVNPVLRPVAAWTSGEDPLIAEILSRPYVIVLGSDFR